MAGRPFLTYTTYIVMFDAKELNMKKDDDWDPLSDAEFFWFVIFLVILLAPAWLMN